MYANLKSFGLKFVKLELMYARTYISNNDLNIFTKVYNGYYSPK